MCLFIAFCLLKIEKNGNLLPIQVTSCTHKKVWWICTKGYERKASIAHQNTDNTSCPVCFSDNQTSFSEQAIYYFLDMMYPNKVENRYKFKDKEGVFEADIYLPKQKIVIEHDGIFWHKDKKDKDLKKENRFKALGLKFIRIAEALENKVVDNCIFYNYKKDRIKNLSWAICELFAMLNISSLFVDANAFQLKILEFAHSNEVQNSLAVVNPKLAEEWNYAKNGKLKPTMFASNSHAVVWWVCSKGHEWKASINHRASGKGCPYCSNRKLLVGFNDLATVYPNIAKEWNYEKNGGLLPTQVLGNSHKKIWWKCQKCGCEWQTAVYCRTSQGTGCPVCARALRAKKRSIPKKGNSLQEKFPNIAKDWDFVKNGDLTPDKISFGSDKYVHWKCFECGYEWITTVINRTSGYRVCPVCNKEKHKRSK